MKVWFDRDDVDFSKFESEQFLLLDLFDDKVLVKNNDFSKSGFWKSDIGKIVEFTSIEDSDFLLYPKKFDTGIEKYINLGKSRNKSILAFFNDDISTPTTLDNIILYRTSFNNSYRKKNEHCMPAWSADLLNGSLSLRDKEKAPTISFCGAITHPVRRTCLEKIYNNGNIESSIVIRNSFWGGKVHDKQLRLEYIDNILNSDLVLCCRGAGNFSYRLFECLSLGRIPIIVDTDIPLPCSDVIQWSKFIFTTPEEINDNIDRFWKNTTSEQYKDLQKYARYIYETYLSPSGFAKYLNYTLCCK
jgi:hypothetical protein